MQELKLNRLYQSEDNYSDDFILNNNNNKNHDENVAGFDSMPPPKPSPSSQSIIAQNIKKQAPRHLSRSAFEISGRQHHHNHIRARCDDLSVMESLNNCCNNENQTYYDDYDDNYDVDLKFNKERRSYSNSKLDYHKWQRALTRRPAYNRIDQWSSHVLSEYELKKFLKKGGNTTNNNIGHSKEKLMMFINNETNRTSLNPIMVSSMNTESWSNNTNQTNRNHKCKSYSGGLHQGKNASSYQRNKKQTTMTNAVAMLSKDFKSSNLYSSYSASSGGGGDGGGGGGGGGSVSGLKSDARIAAASILDGDCNGIKRNSALVRLGHKLRNHLSSERILFTSGGGGKNGYI